MQALITLENRFLEHIFEHYATPHLALLELAPTDGVTDVTSLEVDYTDYARLALAAGNFSTAASGIKFNSVDLALPLAGAASSVIARHFAICDAATLGNGLFWGPLLVGNPVRCWADADANQIIPGTHSFVDGEEVVFVGDQNPLGNIFPDVAYFVVNASAKKFQIEASVGGGAIDLTSHGQLLVGRKGWLTVTDNVRPTFETGSLLIAAT